MKYALSDWAEQYLVATLLGTANVALTGHKLGLFAGTVPESGGVEVTAAGYARKAVAFEYNGALVMNTAAVTFTLTEVAQVGSIGVFDGSTPGNLILTVDLTEPLTFYPNISRSVPQRKLQISFEGDLTAHMRDFMVGLLLGVGSATIVAPPALALYDGNPLGTGVELSLARVALVRAQLSWVKGLLFNRNRIVFAQSVSDLGFGTWAGLHEGAGGPLLAACQLARPLRVRSGKVPVVPVEDFRLTVA